MSKEMNEISWWKICFESEKTFEFCSLFKQNFPSTQNSTQINLSDLTQILPPAFTTLRFPIQSDLGAIHVERLMQGAITFPHISNSELT